VAVSGVKSDEGTSILYNLKSIIMNYIKKRLLKYIIKCSLKYKSNNYLKLFSSEQKSTTTCWSIYKVVNDFIYTYCKPRISVVIHFNYSKVTKTFVEVERSKVFKSLKQDHSAVVVVAGIERSSFKA
jgi:hypothetical protein